MVINLDSAELHELEYFKFKAPVEKLDLTDPRSEQSAHSASPNDRNL